MFDYTATSDESARRRWRDEDQDAADFHRGRRHWSKEELDECERQRRVELERRQREDLLNSIAQDKLTEGEIDELARLDEMKRKFHRTPREL